MQERPNGPNRLPVHPSVEYQNLLKGDPRLVRWYRFHSQELPELIRNPETRGQIGNIVHAYIRMTAHLKPDIPLPQISWEINNPAVVSVTGTQFATPMIEFNNPNQIRLYRALTDQITGNKDPNHISAGLTFKLPIEFVSQGKLNVSQTRDASVTLLLGKNTRTTISYIERKQHELIHAADPSERKPDRIILRELAAIIGSFADPDANFSAINLNPTFIINYLISELEMTDQLQNFSIDEIVAMTERISNMTYQLTSFEPKIPNDEITRKITASQDLDDLESKFPEVFPPVIVEIVEEE